MDGLEIERFLRRSILLMSVWVWRPMRRRGCVVNWFALLGVPSWKEIVVGLVLRGAS